MSRVDWRKNFNPTLLLEKIDKVRTVDPSGAVSFTGFEVHATLPALHSMLKFPDEARDLDGPNLIWRSLASVKGPLTPGAFRDELDRRVRDKLSNANQDYNVLTSILLRPDAGRKTYQVNGARIRLLAGDYPLSHRKARQALLAKQALPVVEGGVHYRKVIVTVRAADQAQAVERALRSVDLLRACWCYFSNFEMELSGSSWRGINKVRLGPIHTCHLPNGVPTGGAVWFEPHHDEELRKWPKNEIGPHADNLLKRLRGSPIRIQLEDAMIAYVRALDSGDQNAAFLGLWTAMERLVSPGKAEFEAFVRRCAFLFEEGEYHREVLKHLRQYRNEFVHTGRSTSQAKAHCYELQVYFRALIQFYIARRPYISTLDQANAFLDLPTDKNELHRRRRALQAALKFVV